MRPLISDIPTELRYIHDVLWWIALWCALIFADSGSRRKDKE